MAVSGPTQEAAGRPLPAIARVDAVASALAGRMPVLFLDFDGTLAPIVSRPELAAIDRRMRDAVRDIARRCPVAIVSGRDLDDVRARVGIDGIVYAGSHGFDIAGPDGLREQNPAGIAALPALDRAEQALLRELAGVHGVLVERKRFSIAVHYRLAADADVAAIARCVDRLAEAEPALHKAHGKKVFELQPDADWDKGAAVTWLLREMDLDRPDRVPVYLGDDVTDENAFAAIADHGIGIVVAEQPRPTRARYRLPDPQAVLAFLEDLSAALAQRD